MASQGGDQRGPAALRDGPDGCWPGRLVAVPMPRTPRQYQEDIRQVDSTYRANCTNRKEW